MLVSVISLDRGVGVTSTAMLLAMGIGSMQKKALLCHTARSTNMYMDYFGLHELDDKTTNPALLVKLMRDGAITPDAVPDYCRSIAPNSYLFTNTSDLVTNEDMYELCQYFTKQADFDYVIYDMDDWGNPTAKYVQENADVVVICVQQSAAHLKAFKKKLKQFRKMFLNKSVMLVCNRYDSHVGSYKDLAKALEFKSDCFVIHQNSWVGWSQNRGRFNEFFTQCMAKSPDMIEVGSDIAKLVTGLFRIKSLSDKAAQDAKRAAVMKGKEKAPDAEGASDSGSEGAQSGKQGSDGVQGGYEGNSGDSGASEAKSEAFDRTWYRGT